MTTITDTMIDFWYDENTDSEDIELMNIILSPEAFQLIEDEIIIVLKDDNEPELDNDFGDCYWNGSRMVGKPGMCEYFND